MRVWLLIGCLWLLVSPFVAQDEPTQRVAAVVNIPGCVAVWDFVKREPVDERRFLAQRLRARSFMFQLIAEVASIRILIASNCPLT